MSGVAVDPFAPTRTPDQPGPGPLSPASLRALELVVGRRVDGLLSGDYRSAFAGIGSELWQVLRNLPPAGTGSLGAALELADRVVRQRALVLVVSDFRGSPDWRAPLMRLAARHTVLGVEVRDPREQDLADVGELRLVDPETGRQLRVDTSDRRLRERFAAAAADERRALVAT